MKQEGKNAYVELFEDKVEIGPKGWRGAHRGIVRVGYSEIKGIELTPAGLLTFGFLKIIVSEGSVAQGNSTWGRKGDLMNDPFAVAFEKSDMKSFDQLRNKLESLVQESKNLKKSIPKSEDSSNDLMEKIKSLAALKESGFITEEEFQQKKTDLLSRM